MTTTQTLTPSAFTTPDLRASGTDALKNLDMRDVQDELAAALDHIENLPRQYPDDIPGPDERPPTHPLNPPKKERWK